MPMTLSTKLLGHASLLAMTLIFAGCSTFTAPPYVVNPDSTYTLRKLDIEPVSVGEFAAPENLTTRCRLLEKIDFEHGHTYSAALYDAFSDELKLADRYTDTNANVTISGEIDRLKLAEWLFGYWEIDLTLHSSNGQSMSVSNRKSFVVSLLSADTTCTNAATAFNITVRKLFNDAVRSPEFAALLR